MTSRPKDAENLPFWAGLDESFSVLVDAITEARYKGEYQ